MDLLIDSNGERTESEIKCPQLSSEDPEERKLARRLRIQGRISYARKQLQSKDGEEEEKEKTALDRQIMNSADQLETLLLDGNEMVTNIRIASDAREVERRCELVAARQRRVRYLEDEVALALEKCERISSRWEDIAGSSDPLDIYHGLEQQKEKCRELLEQKDAAIEELKRELRLQDARFLRDRERQREELSQLAARIDSQVRIMKRAYDLELEMIEQAVNLERKQLLEINEKKWDTLYKARDKQETNNLEEKFQFVNDFEKQVYDINTEYIEKYRQMKITLETDLQILQQELAQVKAICLMNCEKLDYNYQVLKKRDDENIIVKSQQKRRLNKLTDTVNSLKKKISDLEKSSTSETEHLTEEIIRLHRNIIDFEKKSDKLFEINDTLYNQIWEMNAKTAETIMEKVLTADRVISEDVLSIQWSPPEASIPDISDLEAFQKAEQFSKQLNDKLKDEHGTDGSRLEDFFDESKKYSAKQLLKQILYKISECSEFLIDESVRSSLTSYDKDEQILVKIDTIFNALGIENESNISLLKDFFLPYTVCSGCSKVPPDLAAKSKIPPSERSSESDAPEPSAAFDDAETADAVSSIHSEVASDADADDDAEATDSTTTTTIEKHVCSEYPLTIDPIYALKGLRNFVAAFSSSKMEEEIVNTSRRLAKSRHSFSKLVADDAMEEYWRKYEEIFPPHKEKFWAAVHLALSKYHKVLEDRHGLNIQCQQLSQQNSDLKRLLHGYIVSGGSNASPKNNARVSELHF